MAFIKFILQDWKANRGNWKGRTFLLLFRIANFFSKHKAFFFLGVLYIIFYKVFVQWLFTLEIPWNVQIGKNFSLYHGQAIVMNKDVRIGENCTIRHCVTIGIKQKLDSSISSAPIIGDNVDIGSNVCIIGDLTIGNNVKIGSGSVVVKSVASDCIVAGNPAVEKRRLSSFELM